MGMFDKMVDDNDRINHLLQELYDTFEDYSIDVYADVQRRYPDRTMSIYKGDVDDVVGAQVEDDLEIGRWI